ncbi:MAG TPA: hypothetical protein VD835_20500, partial [Pyrinomonadaceae bacterium]|nr:hypothetical protein [Pyrinomonadaceae bacterium]
HPRAGHNRAEPEPLKLAERCPEGLASKKRGRRLDLQVQSPASRIVRAEYFFLCHDPARGVRSGEART